MKAIMVMFDSLNRHMLPNYGCDWTHAPNFKRLGERTVTFDQSYIGSMPCMPARRELHTGRYNFLHRSWGPLEPFDDSMPEILKQHGIYTHLVSDHQHYWEDGGATYHNRYSSWEFSRGQEGDRWKGHVAEPDVPDIGKKQLDLVRQDWINRAYLTDEALMPQAQTFASGLHFIDQNYEDDNWFLQIETFDPHEPFFTQQVYKELYPHEYDGIHFDWPDYKQVTEPKDQVEHVRYEYAALLSMCDAYLGKLLDKMDELNLWEDTLLIVCTDHGYLLGEHQWWAKGRMPWYSELARTPLFIWDPRAGKRNTRNSQLVQMIDIPVTLLDYFGVAPPADMQGHALAETIKHDTRVRDAALFGMFGGHVNVTDGRYVYMRAPLKSNRPLYNYTLMPTHMRHRFDVEELQFIELVEPFRFTKGCPLMRIAANFVPSFQTGDTDGLETLLFDLENDPSQEVALKDEAIEERMVNYLSGLMRANNAPPDQFERLGLFQER